MDDTTLWVIAILAVVVLAGFLLFRGKVRASLKGPGGTGMDFEGSNRAEPAAGTTGAGARVARARSRTGSIEASDHTGRGAEIEDADAYGDVRATSAPSGHDPPKGPPRA